MLSNKWTFSLTSLVVILTLSLVAPSAMAGEFGASLSIDDVSHAGGNQAGYTQVNNPSDTNKYDPTDLTVKVKFDKAVLFASWALAINTYDKDGIWIRTVAVDNTAAMTFGSAVAKVYTVDTTTVAPATVASKEFDLAIQIPDPDAPNPTAPDDRATVKVVLKLTEGIGSADPNNDDTSKEAKLDFTMVDPDPTLTANRIDSSLTNVTPSGEPMVHRIARVPDTGILDFGEAFTAVPAGRVTTETFQAIVVLSEQPKEGKFQAKDDPKQITASEADITAVAALAPIDPRGMDKELGTGDDADFPNYLPTGRDGLIYPYLVTVKPKPGEKKVVINVNMWYDQVKENLNASPARMGNKYTPPDPLVDGVHKLEVLTKRPADPLIQKADGLPVSIPKDKVIPNGGYLVVTNGANTGIHVPDKVDKPISELIAERTLAQQMYNVVEVTGLPNLETFLLNGGLIDVVGPKALTITEINWGSDSTPEDSTTSQWIELRNDSGAEYKTQDGDNTTKLIFYRANETAPGVTTVKDRVGTIGTSGYWSIEGKGQSGRSNIDEGEDIVATSPTVALISMQRAADAAGVLADGTMASSWSASVPPALNYDPAIEGIRVGTPGAAPSAYPEPPAPEVVVPEVVVPATPVATATDIGITEIMVDTGNDRLPQWIELTNLSSAAVSLAGWSAVIDNAADADVFGEGAPITLDLGDIELGVGEGTAGDLTGVGKGQAALLITWTARHSPNLGQEGISARIVDLSVQLEETGRYQLLSYMGFTISLMPPQTSAIATYGNVVGNLGMDWEIPMAEAGRSSIIRREMDDAMMALMGTAADGWQLASATDLIFGPISWYGSDEDAGTPGYDSGGPLPVELSNFYPARDKVTGQVVITWKTQSELNNAGFFIKRSEQSDGKFLVINPTMIPGAGTTAEKQSYTYTDTTAKPNVLYYYQIEDVSLDGQRQTLTHGTRLRGHIGAAGKVTTTWGELKAQE